MDKTIIKRDHTFHRELIIRQRLNALSRPLQSSLGSVHTETDEKHLRQRAVYNARSILPLLLYGVSTSGNLRFHLEDVLFGAFAFG